MRGRVDRPTIDDLIAQHHSLLYRYAYRLSGSAADAEDLTQQTYLTAHANLHQLREASAAKSWLCSILRRAFLRQEKLRRRLATVPLDRETEPREEEETSPVDEESLQRVLGEMPEDYRSAVILFYFQELSYKEIAEILEIPMGTVMSRLSRGRAWLKAGLMRSSARRSAGESSPLRVASSVCP